MGLNFAAFANIPLGVGWICSLQGHYNCARKCTVIAAPLALQTMQLYLQDQADLFAYANGRAHFVGPHIGFFFWFASILLIWREPRIPPADREMFTLKI
jgi:hypothetical protein